MEQVNKLGFDYGYQFSIVSPELKGKTSAENSLSHSRFRIEFLLANEYKPVVGMYKGNKEYSYLLKNKMKARRLGRAFEQESVLEVYRQKNGILIAYLYFPSDASEVYLGRFYSVGTQEPQNVDGYTFNPETSTYYIID